MAHLQMVGTAQARFCPPYGSAAGGRIFTRLIVPKRCKQLPLAAVEHAAQKDQRAAGAGDFA
jgi:hypothetical protein